MMLSLMILLCILSVFSPSSTLAGEVVLYGRTNCNDFPFIFSADTNATDCRQAEQGLLGPLFYGATTSRNIGPSCKYSLYTDTNCKTLAGSITSSGPLKKCLPITKGLKSYKVTCKDPVAAALVRPNTQPMNLNTYFQPRVTYRNMPSGNHDIVVGAAAACERYTNTKATGKPNTAGTKLASAFFQQVPANTRSYTTSIVDGGTLYRIILDGNQDRKYTAASAARTVGRAAFASLMADTVAYLQSRPCDSYAYDIFDRGNSYLVAQINLTFVAP